MERIALFNYESFTSSEAILSFIETFHEQLVLVVASQRYGGKNGSFFKQVLENYRRSGFRYLMYLGYNFVWYFWAVHFFHFIALLRKKPSKFLTVKEQCKKYKIPYIKSADVNSLPMTERLRQANLDYIITYYFDQILKLPTIQLPKKGVLNVHEAYLPECRGVFPEFCTALKGQGEFGITVHEIVDASIDTGPILAQKHVEVPPDKSILLVGKIINKDGVDLVSEVIKHFDIYRRTKLPQHQGSYYSFPTREDIQAAHTKGIRLCSFREFVSEFV
ncbi:MAG: formyltransferase family protein [Ktedonobacteraceae bacterium]